jgi:hypothetical protein
MNVEIFGKKIEVAVSEQGVFHDKETKQIFANTLKGLKKKLIDANTVRAAVPVEKEDGSKQGLVINYDGSMYTVKWQNGKTTLEYSSSLRKPTTLQQRQKLAELEAAQEAAQEVADSTYAAFEDFESELSVHEDLLKTFHRR